MGMSLEEYAEKHGKQVQPAEDRQTMSAIADEISSREEQTKQAEEMKEGILEQLKKGNEPQLILYTALKCIGLLSHDTEWADAARGYLDNIYGDLAQQSLIDDNAAIASHRLQEQEESYNTKLRRQLSRQIAGYDKIAKGLKEALDALNNLEQGDQKASEEQS